MQPGHIRVFDGLRVSTEHLDHFQGSLHSALGDVRRILGLGRVHRGFAVTRGDGDQIAVQPGLAFDFAGNRLVSDEVVTLPAMPPIPGAPGHVCISYAQVEDGVVDGRPTLIFDSVTIEVRQARPKPGENVLVIALLVADDTAGFTVVDPQATANGNGAAAGRGAPASGGNGARSAATNGTVRPDGGAVSALGVRQGVLRLRGDDASRNALNVLRGAMSMNARNDTAPAPSATLASVVLPVGFAPASVSCHGAFEATLHAEVPVRCRGMSHGDATLAGGAVAQQCVAQAELDVPGTRDVSLHASAVSQSYVAGVPFISRGGDDDGAPPSIPIDVLRGLVLGIALGAATDTGVTLTCRLDWDGTVTPEILDWLGASAPALSWSVDLAWKALGSQLQPTQPAAGPHS